MSMYYRGYTITKNAGRVQIRMMGAEIEKAENIEKAKERIDEIREKFPHYIPRKKGKM